MNWFNAKTTRITPTRGARWRIMQLNLHKLMQLKQCSHFWDRFTSITSLVSENNVCSLIKPTDFFIAETMLSLLAPCYIDPEPWIRKKSACGRDGKAKQSKDLWKAQQSKTTNNSWTNSFTLEISLGFLVWIYLKFKALNCFASRFQSWFFWPLSSLVSWGALYVALGRFGLGLLIGLGLAGLSASFPENHAKQS